MKRNNVGKSKSFQMRRTVNNNGISNMNNSNGGKQQQRPRLRERSVDRSRIVTSYDSLGLKGNPKQRTALHQRTNSFNSGSQRQQQQQQQQQQPDLHWSDDSDSDCDAKNILLTMQPQQGNEVISDKNNNSNRFDDLSQLVSYIGLPNLMFFSSSSSASASASSSTPSLSSSAAAATTTTTTTTFQTPTRTRSKFKPAYLLQKRKQGLVQHQPLQQGIGMGVGPGGVPPFPEQPSRKHSMLVLLLLVTACYLLMSLAKTTTTTDASSTVSWAQSSSTSSSTTYYYLNLKEEHPIPMVTKMLTMHAYAFQQQQQQQSAKSAKFVGVCGYPTYQEESQRRAMQILIQMGLQEILQFDVCPPIEAILHRDPQYVLLEENDIPTTTTSSAALLSDPVWQATIASQTKPTPKDPTDLWQQVLSSSSSNTVTTTAGAGSTVAGDDASEPRRRLRGLEDGSADLNQPTE